MYYEFFANRKPGSAVGPVTAATTKLINNHKGQFHEILLQYCNEFTPLSTLPCCILLSFTLDSGCLLGGRMDRTQSKNDEQ
jgi:hypothetical protein